VTLFPHTDAGDNSFNFFKKVVAFHKLEKIGNAPDVCVIHLIRGYARCLRVSSMQFNYKSGQVWLALITFLYVDLFDTTG
jgi:adenine/guanine/hypoxanthine permease